MARNQKQRKPHHRRIQHSCRNIFVSKHHRRQLLLSNTADNNPASVLERCRTILPEHSTRQLVLTRSPTALQAGTSLWVPPRAPTLPRPVTLSVLVSA